MSAGCCLASLANSTTFVLPSLKRRGSMRALHGNKKGHLLAFSEAI
jgi:hypothetical protein